MRVFLRNKTQEAKAIVVRSTNADTMLDNESPGPNMVSRNDDYRLDVALSPAVTTEELAEVVSPNTTGELDLEGKFVVEVNGVIVPFYFAHNQLPNYFKGTDANVPVIIKVAP